ncbi:MAG: NAD(P)H-binding protein [Planctomycetota bacterium]
MGERVVAVTGATGFVGRHMVRALLERGHRVRGMVRDAEKASGVLPPHERLEWVQEPGGISEDSAERLVEGCDTAVHTIGIIREASGGQTFKRMHTEATRWMVRACEHAGTQRYLHMSALGVRDHGISQYQKTKFEAEQIVRFSDLDWTIFRPGLIHGSDSAVFEMMKKWCEGRDAPWLFLPYFLRTEVVVPGVTNDRESALPLTVEAPKVAPVHIDDVCEAFCLAMEHRESVGEIYALAGPETMTWPEMLRRVRDALPQAKDNLIPIGLPAPIAAAKAWALKQLGMGDLLPFDVGMALMAAEDSVAPSVKARAQLGYEPRAFTESMRGYAAGA